MPLELEDVGRVTALAAAIAHAEGFWVPGARPRRNRNPGDLLDASGTNITYPSVEDGFTALARQVVLMLAGESHVYTYATTWRRVAQLWTGGDNAAAWCESVAADLGIDPDSTLGQFAQPATLPLRPMAPSLQTAPAPASQAAPQTQG